MKIANVNISRLLLHEGRRTSLPLVLIQTKKNGSKKPSTNMLKLQPQLVKPRQLQQ